MKINYTSPITNTRTSARVDQNLWEIFTRVGKETGASEERMAPELWVAQFAREFEAYGKEQCRTFAGFISLRLKEEIMMDLDALGSGQLRLPA